MKRFQRLLVPLRLSPDDAALVRYAAMVARVSRSERVYFAHVADDFDLPDEARAALPAPEPLDEQVRAEMRALVEANFDGPAGVDVRFEVREGAELVRLLDLARRKRADLVVVGRGNDRDPGEATLPVKLARKAPCSVLVVPDGTPATIDRILVPVDFSERSRDALDVAIAFGEAFAADPLEVLHVYGVPSGYARMARSHGEVVSVIHRGAETELEAFVDGSDLRGLGVHAILQEGSRPSDGILDAIGYVEPDLVVVGTRGRTDSAAVLLGSTAERVIARATVPILAAKRSAEARSLLDVLFSHD